MIHFARPAALIVFLASFGVLEDLLLETNLFGRGGCGGKASSRSAFFNRDVTSIGDSVASRSVHSLPTVTESTESEQVAMGSHEPVPVVRVMRRCLVGPLCMIKVGPIV